VHIHLTTHRVYVQPPALHEKNLMGKAKAKKKKNKKIEK
jgi:hypothetical protein